MGDNLLGIHNRSRNGFNYAYRKLTHACTIYFLLHATDAFACKNYMAMSHSIEGDFQELSHSTETVKQFAPPTYCTNQESQIRDHLRPNGELPLIFENNTSCARQDELSTSCVKIWLQNHNHIQNDWKVDKIEDAEGSTIKSIFVVRHPQKPHAAFIVKHMGDIATCREEVAGLANVCNSSEIRQSQILTPTHPNLPTITQAEDAVQFRGQDGPMECLILLHAAQGDSVNKLDKEYENDQRALNLLAASVGENLGAWHATSLKMINNNELTTLVHGDANHGNIFCDPKKNQSGRLEGFNISFIDNNLIKRGDPMVDVRQFLSNWIRLKKEAKHEIDRIEELLQDDDAPEAYKNSQRPGIETQRKQYEKYKQMIKHFRSAYSQQYDTKLKPQIEKKLDDWLQSQKD